MPQKSIQYEVQSKSLGDWRHNMAFSEQRKNPLIENEIIYSQMEWFYGDEKKYFLRCGKL